MAPKLRRPGSPAAEAVPEIPDHVPVDPEPRFRVAVDRVARRERLVPGIILTIAVGALVVAWIHMRRGQFFDPLDIDVFSVYSGNDLLTGYHGHLSIVPASYYQALLSVFGVSTIWPYAISALVIYTSVAVAFYWSQRDQGDRVLVALAAAALVWAWPTRDNLRYDFMINFYLPVVMLLISWRLIRKNTVRDDAWSALAVTIALGSSSVGLVVVAALVIELAVQRAFKRILWYVVPVAFWGIWYLTSDHVAVGSSWAARAAYAWRTIVSILAGFTIGWRPGAILIALGIAVVMVLAWRRWDTFDAHAWGVLGALGVFVALITVSRAVEPGITTPYSPRYTWLGDLLLIALLLTLLRGRKPHWPTRFVAFSLLVLGAGAMLAGLQSNRAWLHYSTDAIVPILDHAQASGHWGTPTAPLFYGGRGRTRLSGPRCQIRLTRPGHGSR